MEDIKKNIRPVNSDSVKKKVFFSLLLFLCASTFNEIQQRKKKHTHTQKRFGGSCYRYQKKGIECYMARNLKNCHRKRHKYWNKVSEWEIETYLKKKTVHIWRKTHHKTSLEWAGNWEFLERWVNLLIFLFVLFIISISCVLY